MVSSWGSELPSRTESRPQQVLIEVAHLPSRVCSDAGPGLLLSSGAGVCVISLSCKHTMRPAVPAGQLFFFVCRMKTKWDVKAFRGMVIASRLSQRCMQPCMATEVSILWASRTIVLRGTVNAAYWVIRAWCALLGRSWGVSYLAC